MNRAVWAPTLLLALALGAAPAHADPARFDPTTAQRDVDQARKDKESLDAFCATPELPLSPRAIAFCAEARDIPRCEGFVKACDALKAPEPKEPPAWLARMVEAIARLLGPLIKVLFWVFVAAGVGAIAWMIVRAFLAAREDRQALEAADGQAKALPDAPESTGAIAVASDAEALLRRADEHARAGELDRAALLYLAAALRALDQRGAIRIARDRTNGEYVRACSDAEARPALRVIVREVDRVQFGRESPTREAVADVAARARSLVAGAATVAMLVLALAGCQGPGTRPRAGDPAGDDLVTALLERQGADVKHLATSLATLPMPREEETAPLVVVDADRVMLEDETRAHLARWVEAGGVLVLAGDVNAWPEDFGAKPAVSASDEVRVSIPRDEDDVVDDGDDQVSPDDLVPPAPAPPPRDDGPTFTFYTVHLARPAGLAWAHAYELASGKDHVTWAASRGIKRGVVIGLASDDLLTNAGLARPDNAAALVALLAPHAGRPIRIAKPEDGVAPPSNPFAALARAGLGLAAWHALAAGAILMLAYGVRQARARPVPPPARRAWTEHIDATGGLYARRKLAPHALAAYARFVDGRVRARMPRGTSDPAAFLATRSGAAPAQCATAWQRAMQAKSEDKARGDELATLRFLSAVYAAAMRGE
jgi:hypothetical protein